MTKKQKIKLILSGAELLLALIVVTMAITSMAWYATNKQLTGTGMTVRMVARGSLELYDFPSATGLTYEDPQTYLSRTFHAEVATLDLAAHDDNTALYPNRLKYVSNIDHIDPGTGRSDGEPLVYSAAQENVHYVDFTVYLATMGANLSYEDFAVTLCSDSIYQRCEDSATVQSGVTYYTRTGESFSQVSPAIGSDASALYTQAVSGAYLATCADVYYNNSFNGTSFAESDTFIGTFHLNDSAHWTLMLSESGTLLANQPIKVVLRCYFDGSLTQASDGKAIIRAANQKTGNIFFGVSFDLTPNE